MSNVNGLGPGGSPVAQRIVPVLFLVPAKPGGRREICRYKHIIWTHTNEKLEISLSLAST
ncbi:hypothetical protein KTAU_10510 [Thermogemmatispora aurantia]|jgi:hypothetical protein|uniref:Uncharacterized protein n=1 Tax=Thermogemmatispora aurantia TaxID=2045279 RepID=A0A5J4JZF2_9CHLR|nr:hypothetical protein KTAU_10510 [Thermogemmatispora aurantia]